MLRHARAERTLRENLMLASSTAFVSGAINVAGVIAFLAFTANVTGHVAKLAHHFVQQNYSEIIVFTLWLLMFFSGAFLSNYLIRSIEKKSVYRANATPILIEVIVLLLVAIYGHHFYEETKVERECVIGALLFAMGLQNSMVSTVSGGVIKSTHLTGLFTDLGAEVSELVHPETKQKDVIRNKVYIRLSILSFYLIGGVAGGFFFDELDFSCFYIFPCILLLVLYYDFSPVALHRLQSVLLRSKN